MSDSAQERTEQPTHKRLLDAREKGQIPRSRELNTTVVMVASALGLMAVGTFMGDRLSNLLRQDFTFTRAHLFDKHAVTGILSANLLDAVILIIPFLLITLIAALAGPLLLGGWSFSIKAMAFKFEKLDPIKGLTRVFSLNGLMELVKALLKFLLLGTIATLLLYQQSDDYITLGQLPAAQGIYQALSLLIMVFLLLSLSLILIAAIDGPYQRWNHLRQLRMSRQEIREEMKETDGNPEVRGKLRALQREMAQRKMLQDVPKADVVVVNPTHYAVALRYDERHENAPRVVAKGVDFMALKIREIAAANEVPVFSAPPLTRALYRHAEIGDEVPSELYLAIAQVLAYIFQLRNPRAGAAEPHAPDNLPIPEHFLKEDEH
jgi:flagellar biosynthetic protein FlhB